MAEEPDPPQTEAPEGEVQADQLTDELTRKYDPERLLRAVSRRAGRGEALEYSIRAKYERRFGVDLGHVRIYTGEFAEEFNRKRDAYAVTIGATGMVLMGGSPDRSMGSAAGKALLAHELTHVAQAHKGLNRSASFNGGMPFAEEHEEEAEATEAAVLHEEAGGHHAAAGVAGAGANAAGAKEKMDQALEQIRDRVFQMAAEAARSQITRNGVQRRP